MISIEHACRAPDTGTTLRVESRNRAATSTGCHMHADAGPGVRPCFSHANWWMTSWSYQRSLGSRLRNATQRQPGGLRHVVLASDADAFNLGGDLELFCRLIRAGDREHLLAYARRCVDGVHALPRRPGRRRAHSIALVQGDALGGGFEAALSLPHHRRRGRRRHGPAGSAVRPVPGHGRLLVPVQARPAAPGREDDARKATSTPARNCIAWAWSTCSCRKGEGEAGRAGPDPRSSSASPHAHLAMNAVRGIAQPVGYDELMRHHRSVGGHGAGAGRQVAADDGPASCARRNASQRRRGLIGQPTGGDRARHVPGFRSRAAMRSAAMSTLSARPLSRCRRCARARPALPGPAPCVRRMSSQARRHSRASCQSGRRITSPLTLRPA